MSSPRSEAAAPPLPPGATGRPPWRPLQALLTHGRLGAAELLLDSTGLWDLGAAQHHAGFAAWCAAHPGQRCRLWLADDSVSDLVCSASAPIFSGADRLAWARRVLTHYHGREAQQWPLAAWQWRGALGVSSARAGPLAAWQASARDRGVRIVALRPLWMAWLARLLRARPGLRRSRACEVLLIDLHAAPGVLTLLQLQRGRPVALVRKRLGADVAAAIEAATETASSPVREGERQRVASVLGLGPAAEAAAAAARVAGFEMLPGPHWPPPPGWLDAAPPEPDFLQPLPRPTRAAWAALAAVGAVLMVAGLDAREAWLQRERSLQGAALAAAPEPGPRRQAAAGAEGAPTATRRAVRVGATEVDPSSRLQHPWDEAFLAAERASLPGIQWLAFDHAGASGELRLAGVSRDERAPARAVALLRADVGWMQVLLARQEPREGGGHGFEISMRRAAVMRAAEPTAGVPR